MGAPRLATGKKNAARLKAWLVFIDESGFLTSPWRRRTWAPRGQTPVLLQRGNSRQKASVIAALAVSPRRRTVRLLVSLRPHENVNAAWVLAFVRALARHLGPRMVILWDNLNAHRAHLLRQALQRWRHLRYVYLPPYAPELNPTEYVWGYLKTNPLANRPPDDIDELVDVASRELDHLGDAQDLLRSFLRHSPLSLRLR